MEKLALAGVQNDVYFYAPGVTKAELGQLGARAFDTLDERWRRCCAHCLVTDE